MRTVRDGHASGINSATEDDWQALAERMARDCDVFSFTERRRDITLDGFDCFRPKGIGGGLEECPILWRRELFRLAGPRIDATGFEMLTTRSFPTHMGTREGVGMSWVLLTHIEQNWTYLRCAFHLPAHVQSGKRFRLSEPRNSWAWRGAVKGLSEVVRELQAELRPDEVTLTADFNVDLDQEVWAERVQAPLRGTGVRLKVPTEPTHVQRTIDAHASTMHRTPNGYTDVLPKRSPYDHKAIVADLKGHEKKENR